MRITDGNGVVFNNKANQPNALSQRKTNAIYYNYTYSIFHCEHGMRTIAMAKMI